MSIYATHWILQFPRSGDAYSGCEWVTVFGQGVPAHIGTPTPGYGYETGDPYSSFLPAAVAVVDDEAAELRAMVVVRQETEKVGQEYIAPLLVLSGEDYAAMPFQELHDRVCDALRGRRPRLVAETIDDTGVTLLFEDGSTERLRDDEDAQ